MADSIGAYGGSGSFKTTQLLFIAKYCYKRWQKTTRLASIDLGGWKPLEPACEAGLIQAWGVSAVEAPRSVLRKLSQGCWPTTQTRDGAIKIVLEDSRATLRDKIGCFAVDGITEVANIIMRDALNKQLIVSADQKGKGEDGLVKFSENVTMMEMGKELTKEEKYSFSTRGNYNDAQRAAYDYMANMKSLPCPLVYLTFREAKAEEEDTGKTILGPAIIGKAMTPNVSAMVGDLIHMEDFFEDQVDPTHKLTPEQLKAGMKPRMRQIVRVRAWFIRHPDPRTGMLFPAKPRVAPDQIKNLLEVFPGGYFEPTPDAGMDIYLETIDRLQAGSSGNIREFMKSIDMAKENAAKIGGTDAAKAPEELVRATTGATK
jgi:hypothetical protein